VRGSPGQLRHLLDHLRVLYAQRDLSGFRQAVVSCLRELVPSDYVSCDEGDLPRRRVEGFIFPEVPPGLMPAFERHMGEHPLGDNFQRTGDLRARTISDFLSATRFRDLGLYSEFFRHIDVEDQLGVCIPVPGGRLIGVTATRSSRSFTSRDRRCLDLLRPHLVQAHENVRFLIELQSRNRDDDDRLPLTDMTGREREVLTYVERGRTNAEIGIILGVSGRTVQKHLERVFRKLGVETRTAAVHRLRELARQR
jgi:DNA-binding CsgD family transcriptional regulator